MESKRNQQYQARNTIFMAKTSEKTTGKDGTCRISKITFQTRGALDDEEMADVFQDCAVHARDIEGDVLDKRIFLGVGLSSTRAGENCIFARAQYLGDDANEEFDGQIDHIFGRIASFLSGRLGGAGLVDSTKEEQPADSQGE